MKFLVTFLVGLSAVAFSAGAPQDNPQTSPGGITTIDTVKPTPTSPCTCIPASTGSLTINTRTLIPIPSLSLSTVVGPTQPVENITARQVQSATAITGSVTTQGGVSSTAVSLTPTPCVCPSASILTNPVGSGTVSTTPVVTPESSSPASAQPSNAAQRQVENSVAGGLAVLLAAFFV